MKAFLRPQTSLRPYAKLEGENSASGRPRSLTDLSPAVEAPTMTPARTPGVLTHVFHAVPLLWLFLSAEDFPTFKKNTKGYIRP